VSEALALSLPAEAIETIAERAAELVLARLQADIAGGSPWLDWQGAADYLGCKPKRIRNLTSQGRIPFHREGGRVVYHRQELDAWVLEGRAEL
jgi:excisionase family DNA binding protein